MLLDKWNVNGIMLIQMKNVDESFLSKLHLMLLAQNRGRVFSKEQIYNAVWNNKYIFDERNMTAYINKIRRKIEPDPAHPRYIITV